MSIIIRPSNLRWHANRRHCPLGPHAPPTCSSLCLKQNLAQIDWPVVLTAGVLSLLLMVSTTVTTYYESRAVTSGNKKLARLLMPVSPKTPSAGAISSLPLDAVGPRPEAPLLVATTEQPRPFGGAMDEKPVATSPPTSLEATLNQVGSPQYPEENQTAMALASARPAQIAENLENLPHSLSAPEPPPSLILKREAVATSEAAQASSSCAGDYGTSVKFVKDPQEAFRLAGEQKKIVFLLHLSGNFEDANFT